VFLATENDHYRTRLTHTLEVAQIARTVARALELNEDLTEAIALGHDLGHTPFGHAGERALDAALQSHDPAARFRHFEQSLRVVEVLENQGAGLNLTWEVLDGIGHHSKGRAGIAGKDLPATMEGQCVRIADRVAYVHHDFEDAVRAGFLCEDDLPEDVLRVFGRTPGQRMAYVITDLVEHSQNADPIGFSPETARLLDTLKEFLFERVYTRELDKNLGLDVENVVRTLFDRALADPGFVPDWLRSVAAREYGDTDRAVVQAAVDFVAGMTDRYALSLASKA
jgi:dGTPase